MVRKENALVLMRPTLAWKEEALAYKKEHLVAGETVINGSELWDKTDCYEEWLAAVIKNQDPLTVSPDWVVTDTFFGVEEQNRTIVGMIALRHTLNDFLKDFGHCGYSVRPSQRGKGYATQMLGQVIEVARKVGLAQLQLSVERTNLPSLRTIEKNGAHFVRSFSFGEEQADIYGISL